MENFEVIQINRPEQEALIEDFRAYFRDEVKASRELFGVSLVSHHDSSIRFTNSTTSVMKPQILGTESFNQPLYLAQPAMGQQGLYYWQRDRVFGPYASYFTSLGALYPSKSEGFDAGPAMESLALRWGLGSSELRWVVYQSDEDLIPLIEETDIPIHVRDQEIGPYRHSYGLEDIGGRNANLLAKDRTGTFRTLGSLTLIHGAEDILGYEISFDSTTATSLTRDFAHPVLSHTTTRKNVSDDTLANVDMLSVSAALLVEGMKPISKGRSGVLRKFMLEYTRLMKTESEATVDDIQNGLSKAVEKEIEYRRHVISVGNTVISQNAAEQTISEWAKPLYELA